MKISKLNDWLKVLLVHLGGGLIYIVCLGMNKVVSADFRGYLWGVFSILAVFYYILAGAFLKNVKAYKIFILFLGLFPITLLFEQATKIVSSDLSFVPKAFAVILSGGGLVFNNLLWVFREEIEQYIEVLFALCVVGPSLITYISVLVRRKIHKKTERNYKLMHEFFREGNMKISKLNDWLKVLLVHLGGGVLSWLSIALTPVVRGEFRCTVFIVFFVLTIVYYNLAGFFLKNVKGYKVFIILGIYFFAALFVLALSYLYPVLLDEALIGKIVVMPLFVILSGGASIFLLVKEIIFGRYPVEGYLEMAAVFAPFIITYVGMLISRVSYRISEKEKASEVVCGKLTEGENE